MFKNMKYNSSFSHGYNHFICAYSDITGKPCHITQHTKKMTILIPITFPLHGFTVDYVKWKQYNNMLNLIFSTSFLWEQHFISWQPHVLSFLFLLLLCLSFGAKRTILTASLWVLSLLAHFIQFQWPSTEPEDI